MPAVVHLGQEVPPRNLFVKFSLFQLITNAHIQINFSATRRFFNVRAKLHKETGRLTDQGRRTFDPDLLNSRRP